MKAIVWTKYGSPDGLQLQEVETPTPKDGEVLVGVHAATVTAGDLFLGRLPPALALLLRLIGVRQQKIPGIEFAGKIEAVGRSVSRFKAGDAVFGTTTGRRFGANAEYVCVSEAGSGVLAAKPASLSYEEAAALPVGGMTAMHFLKKANIQGGQTALIYGASGSVGTYAVQLARHFGAKVTGVCSSANVDLVKSLGAAMVIDYTCEAVANRGEQYDIIFDAVGKLPASDRKNALKADGAYVSVKSLTRELAKNLFALKTLAETGAVRAVIDRSYPLAQTAEAHRYTQTGHKRGNVVIRVA